MPSHSRENSHDRELVLRHQSVPMWDSSDPERAPPPLPMNPSSTSPVTRSNVSPGIQAAAANFAEKIRENAPSPYTTNPMPPKSPEKSLIKGQFHKRMQSFQNNTDARSEFLNYLENRSPERPQRASTFEPGSKSLEKSALNKTPSSPDSREPDRDMPSLLISNRYLSRPILGESTPPSATMLALQNMQLPLESDAPQKLIASDPFVGPKRADPYSFESLSTQIHSLTDIASNLQREMAQLSRRSKDNATDLVSLKAATNARDEDIRKSLRDLSSSLASKFLDSEAATSSPNSKKSYAGPRMSSPNPFAAAMERELCGSPTPISDGSASIALLEKVLREMATKENQDKLLEVAEEIKARPISEASGNPNDGAVTTMLEEILSLVKDEAQSKALVRSHARELDDDEQANIQNSLARSKSMGAEDMNANPERALVPMEDHRTEEMLAIMKIVKNSVIEGGGMTNQVKALVRELRGEVLGMGRNLARQIEEAESSRAIEDKPSGLQKEEVAAIIENSLHDLRGQLASIIEDSKFHASSLSDFRANVNDEQIYSIVKQALDELDFSQLRPEPQGPVLERDDILETVREAWESYKPEIELQNFGLERDEILECLSEGLKDYKPQHEEAVTYDQVLTAVQAGMQSFEQPPSITKEEIVQTIHDCLANFEPPAPPALGPERLDGIREEILQAVTESVTSQSALSRESLDSGLGRDEILSALSEGLETHFASTKATEHPHITKEDVADVFNEAFAAHQSALTTNVQPSVSRDEILNAIAEGMESQNAVTREIELNRDDLMEAISAGLQEANAANQNSGDQMLEQLQEHLDGMKEELSHHLSTNERDSEQLLNAIKDGIAVVRQELEGYAATAAESSAKHEIMDTVKEGFRLLQADMEKTITETALSNSSRGNPDTPELLDAMEKEFEHLRQTISNLLIRSNVSTEKDEILDAIRDISDQQKSSNNEEITKIIKEQIEELRDTMNMSLVRAEPTELAEPTEKHSDKEDIIAALRESLDNFREENNQPKDAGENLLAATSEIIDTVNNGFGTIKEDLAKLLEKPVEFDHSELLDTLKEGLSSLKADVEMLRQSHTESHMLNDEPETTRGGELMLANVPSEPINPGTSNDFEALKTLISQLQTKVEAIEGAPRSSELPEDIVKREHLDEVLLGLHELQSAVTGIVARDQPADETTAKKEDTDAIETLLRNTKSQLDEMKFPAADEIAKAEQLQSLEAIVAETKEAISELSTRIESEGPTKAEIGTLETLMKDMWIALDELKGKAAPEEDNAEKLVKADLQTVEAMIFEVKTQVEELKLPDVETLPTKTEIQDLTALVTEFREKVDADNEMTGQAFDARKVEHAGLAEKIEEARAVVEGLGDELKSKLDGSDQGLAELKQLLEGLAVSAESFTTVENVNELTELINREFERARGEQDATKLEKEERDAAAMVKQDETRAAIIVELGSKIDEKLGEVMAKYDEVHAAMDTALDSKFSEAADRDNAHLEAVTSTKALAEDIKLVIGSMGNSVTEACERMTVDAQTFFEKVDESYNKMEEMHNQVKTQQEQARSDLEKAAAATDRVESQLHEFHPQVLESIQQILAIVGQHYDHSQKSAQEIRMDLSTIPSTITPLLPALPPPEPEKYDDTPVQEKLNNLLEHAKNNQVQETLSTLMERVTNDQVHEKLDQLLSQTTSTNGQVYEKLEELLGHATNSNAPVHDKLDTLIDHATNTDQSVNQMMKLDEMHRDIMETSQRMNEMFAAQSAMIAEDNERRRKEAEEAAIALERRNAQREQVEAEIETLREEKDSLLNIIHSLKSEKDNLIKQTTKLNKEVAGLEMALELRHEEMQLMEDRADSLEKRILEGVLDHARSVLLSRPNSLNMKKARGSRARGPSAASTASTAKDVRSFLGSSVGMALKKRGPAGSRAGSGAPPTSSKERRILSLSNVTGNRGAGDRHVSASSGFTGLKRSHSVKSNFSQRKASWGGKSSVANKENEVFPEEDENQSEDGSDAGTERRTSYTGTYADSMVYGPGSVVSGADRRVSATSSVGPRSVADDLDEGESEASEVDDDAQTTRADDPEESEVGEEGFEDDEEFDHPLKLDEQSSKLVVYGQHSDSGIGPEVTSVAA